MRYSYKILKKKLKEDDLQMQTCRVVFRFYSIIWSNSHLSCDTNWCDKNVFLNQKLCIQTPTLLKITTLYHRYNALFVVSYALLRQFKTLAHMKFEATLLEK